MWDSLKQTWFNGSTSDQFITRDHFHLARRFVCAACVAYGRRLSFALSGAATYTQYAGYVAVCKIHDQGGFCGVCFKDEAVLRNEPPDYYSTLYPVDDFDNWFGSISYTCEKCRITATRQAMKRHGINTLMAQQTDMDDLFANYHTYGEGSVQELCIQVCERKWLLHNTKIKDYSYQAVAGDRLMRGFSMEQAAYSDSEDLAILYTEPSIRELATRDFVRNLILGGSWFSPLDVIDLQTHPRQPHWHGNQPNALLVIHPTSGERKYAHWVYHVPSAELRELLQMLWSQCMIDILETAFKNIIAEVSDGCLVDSKVWEFDKGESAPGTISDPGTQLSSWTLLDVWKRLLKPEFWVTGYNWRSRKLEEHRERRISDASSRSKSSSASSESTNLLESPTGTTSTLQTTPSPPPAVAPTDPKSPTMASVMSAAETARSIDGSETNAAALPDIELTGVEARAVQSVPFVPATFDVLPGHSLRWIWALWSKSIHPLVTCQCSICKRACQLQEEERLRGAAKKAPTGGIVINEPVPQKKEEESEDEDVADELEMTDDVFDQTLDEMDTSPIDIDEKDTTLTEELAQGKDTPVQLIQHPATPPSFSTNTDLDSSVSTPASVAQTLLARIGGRSSTPVLGSLSPPTSRKRASQEPESLPSSPSSAKRRRLDSGDSKLDSPGPMRSPLSTEAQSRSGDTPSSSGPDSVAHASPPMSDLHEPSMPLSQASTIVSGARDSTLSSFGLSGSNQSVGIDLGDYTLDEDAEEGAEGEQGKTIPRVGVSNEQMHWE
ncbi:hypothetical protein M408DRAFT_289672 [Serendipita vermifera MAFF 305830]|uniref:Uncharacterized protein n=1 Tax=Serendipita vermifera MAFF 305830 TaxID=933852 RepID=A0A0C3BGV6_SERVB|nr:hypothetical protein M408DRAFT_289672 [Serendipita vermifera MAFF 305830]